MLLRAALLLLPLGLCLGCQTQPANVFISRMSVGPATSSGFTLNFQFGLGNTSSDPLVIKQIRYQVSIAGTQVAQDRYPVVLTITTSGPVGALARVTWDKLVPAMDAIAKADGKPDVLFDGAAGDVALVYRGVLPLRQLLSSPEAAGNADARRLAAKLGMTLAPPASSP